MYQVTVMTQKRLSNVAMRSMARDFNADSNTVIVKSAEIKTRRFFKLFRFNQGGNATSTQGITGSESEREE